MKKAFIIFILMSFPIFILAQCWENVSAGGEHTLSIKTDRTLWAWGLNQYGQLGDGTNDDKNTPVQIGLDNDWKAVSAGHTHSVALKTDGTLWAWGFGVIGYGAENSNIPVQIGADTDWASIAAGDGYTMALKTDGSLWACGKNNRGQLGIGNADHQFVFIRVGADSNWKKVVAKSEHTFGIKTDGTLWGWGYNLNNYFFGTTSISTVQSPLQIPGNNWAEVTTGVNHTVAIKSDGTLWTWGRGSNGMLGNGAFAPVYAPAQCGSDDSWEKVEAGNFFTVALKADGTLWGWGENSFMQLAMPYPEVEFKNIPIQIGANQDWNELSAGGAHVVAVNKNNELKTWGNNAFGALGLGNNGNNVQNPTVLSCIVTERSKAMDISMDIQIFPNPCSNYIKIDPRQVHNATQIDIIDMYGNYLAVMPFSYPETLLDVSALPQGLYILRISTDEQKTIQTKIVIQKVCL